MQGHKVGNFMVKDVSLGLDPEFRQKSLRIKLLISRKWNQRHTLGITQIYDVCTRSTQRVLVKSRVRQAYKLSTLGVFNCID